MACYHPLGAYRRQRPVDGAKVIFFKVPASIPGNPVRYIQLPCGQCIGCRLEQSRQWAVRMHHQARAHNQNAFTTLTYNPDNLPNDVSIGQPPTGTLVPRDLQLFLKRLRKKYGPDIKFFACGEYGPKTLRPHYHICFFNFEPPDLVHHSGKDPEKLYTSISLGEIWGKGNTLTGALTFQSAAYVARYITKKITGPNSDDHYQTIDPRTGEIFQRKQEFTRQSNGIGKEHLQKYISDIYDHDHVILSGGKKVRPPRYYDKLYEMTNPDELAIIKEKREQQANKHAANNTPERLKVREYIQEQKSKLLLRTLNKE